MALATCDEPTGGLLVPLPGAANGTFAARCHFCVIAKYSREDLDFEVMTLSTKGVVEDVGGVSSG